MKCNAHKSHVRETS